MDEDDFGASLYDEAVPAEFEADVNLFGGEDQSDFGIAGQSGRRDVQDKSMTGDPDTKIKDLQAKLRECLVTAERWRGAFKEVAQMVGFTGRGEPEVPSALEAVARLKASESALQEEAQQLRQQEAALQVALSERASEVAELRRELHSAWQSSDPSILQLKQLLLDPAINREFQRLRGELEATQRELKHAQEELQAVNFTQESKIGRQLMSKCRSLQEENEEMGRELAEGKLAQLEMQLSVAREVADEARRHAAALEDHCSTLDEEAEDLQREVFALRRQVADNITGGGGMGGGGGMAGGGGMRMGGGGGGEGMGGYAFRGGMGGGDYRGGRAGGRGFKRPFDSDARFPVKRMMR